MLKNVGEPYFDRIKKGQRAVGQLEMPKIFGKVPWGQHIDIVSRCQLIDEAMFYVNNVVNNGWSRPALNAYIDANLFQAKGTAVTNFDKTLPSSQEKIANGISNARWSGVFPGLDFLFYSAA